MEKVITEMNKHELLDYLKEHPDKFKSLYTKENISKINWDYIPEEIITENKSILETFDWYYISIYQKLSESFIAKHKDWINWDCISAYQKLSESFIAKYKDLVNWKYISERQKLSENFIAEYKDLVNWKYISAHQKLSEKFIAEHKDHVDWNCISIYQKLSESFIAKHKYLVEWFYISAYQKLSKSFITEYKNYLNMYLINDNWLNKSTKFKKRAVVNTGEYECHEDYFIAYKGIRSDRYSKFNFQYQYMPGETYECFSDGSDDDCSFGLSVWTKEEAANYCNELVVKCKIDYEDVTRVVLDDHKIRCSKITILD